MSKLVIQTQHKENYGAHDWDGKGSCPQYWKMKGGNTYVIENLRTRSINKITDSGIPTLSCLLESKSDMFEEYIIDWEIVGDNAVVCDDWESPIVLTFDSETLLWCATQITDNTQSGGYLRKEICTRTETFTLGRGGEQNDYTNQYTMEDGQVLQYSELSKWFASHEEVA